MDLDDFDSMANTRPISAYVDIRTAKEAIEYIDVEWYAATNRRGRWMDLLGDYAGQELFILDGDALVEYVLDNALLAIAKSDDPSFQLPHALHLLERTLESFHKRSATFEIVFWEDSRHLAQHTGASTFATCSRSLARTLVFQHLQTLDIPLHVFKSLTDKSWVQYQQITKPMFVMTNDGGVVGAHQDEFSVAECVLRQRVFLFDLLAQGTAVTLLQGAEFRDSKIMSFVYEPRVDRRARKKLDARLWSVVAATASSLQAQERSAREGTPPTSLSNLTPLRDAASLSIRTLLSGPLKSVQHAPALLHAFLTHLLLLPSLSIAQRARAAPALHSKLKNLLMSSFLPPVFCALEGTALDVDGRVFGELLVYLIVHPDATTAAVLGVDMAGRLEAAWGTLPWADYAALAQAFPVPHSQEANVASPEVSGLLPFTHTLFDKELREVHVSLPPDSERREASSTHMPFATAFADTAHSHDYQRAILPSHLGGEAAKPMDEYARMKALRREQQFMTNMQWQASTLAGAAGMGLHQLVIQPARKRREASANREQQSSSMPGGSAAKPEPRAVQNKKGGKKAKDHVSSADKIRLANAANKQAKMEDTSAKWWAEHLRDLADLDPDAQWNISEDLLRNPRTAEGWPAVEVRIYRLHLKFEQWLAHSEEARRGVHDGFAVAILKMVKELCSYAALFPTASRILAEALHVLGFTAYIGTIVPPEEDLAPDRKLQFQFLQLVKSKTGTPLHKWMRVGEDPISWQLRCFGDFMDRSMDSLWDPRVSFKPDAWQRKVLDCLDARESVLVVAPTSAGKTFISYYAMEKVLRDSDDGILVYVAPTKALVNQVAAEVYARFKKDLNGRSCWAIHTRDHRIHNPQNCQILVTVPEILAILLLSPSLAKTWSHRIQRIVLDEIHSIGQQEGGAVWEQILLLAPCPIIGLSATIGQPESFNNWLASVQEAHGFKHTFIHHPHRYSHLRKFTYLLDKKVPPFRGLTDYVNTQRTKFLHPVSMLSFSSRNVVIPPDYSLEAADCLSLYRAFVKFRTDMPFDVDRLDPARFLASEKPELLKQKDVLTYEAELKQELSALLEKSNPQDSTSPLGQVISELVDPALAKADYQHVSGKKPFYDNLIYLVADLHSSGDLPGIFFQFDRRACENMGQVLLEKLEKAEEAWRKKSTEWRWKIDKWEAWKAQAKVKQKQIERLKKHTRVDHLTETADTSWEASFDPKDPSPQFSFAGSSTVEQEKIDDEIQGLIRWSSVKPWFFRALKRGIGIHHTGMNKGYRTLVESLFRLGFLRVIIATGTLALGINAPTKTSVFCGDSPYLTALMYRQCAGRAGRRGYDLLGKVVFYGLAMDRCQRLALSRLPTLGGSFPLTSTMVLRLFNLLQGSDNAPVAVRAVRSLMHLPHISFVSTVGRQQILHHIRFSIDYLRRAGLLDAKGRPIGLFSIAAHLYYTEPSNLALVALLRGGVLHRICTQPSQLSAERELMVLLCHLFGRLYLSKTYETSNRLKTLIKNSASMVILPPLPEDARRVLEEHDQEILRVFAGYALAYSEQYSEQLRSDAELPLSERAYHGTAAFTPFHTHLTQTALRITARSPFVANSGQTDKFGSVAELTGTGRRGLHLNEYAIPSMGAFLHGGGGTFALNAYLLDFFIHGQVAALTSGNGIRSGDLWYLLQDFDLTLKTIRAGIAQLLMRVSADTENAQSDGVTDSGYSSFNPAEMDNEEADVNDGGMKRPPGVLDEDWRVYEIVDAVSIQFAEKYKAMWA